MHPRTSEFGARRRFQDDERDRQDNSRHERRMRAGRLLMDGMRQAQVARAVGVSRKAVSLWNRQPVAAGGLCGLQGHPRGRRAGLNAQQRAELLSLLMNGALAWIEVGRPIQTKSIFAVRRRQRSQPPASGRLRLSE